MQGVEKSDHLLALGCIGKPPPACAEIICHMLGVAGAGHHRCYRLGAEQVFEKELAPTRRVEIGRPFGQLFPPHRAEESVVVKRHISQYCRADFGCGRDYPLLCVAKAERVIDLQKVRLLPPEHGFDGVQVTALSVVMPVYRQ